MDLRTRVGGYKQKQLVALIYDDRSQVCIIVTTTFQTFSIFSFKAIGTGIAIVPIQSTDLAEEMSLEAEDAQLEVTAVQVMTTENPYDTIDTPSPSTRANELDRVRLVGPRTDLCRGKFLCYVL